MNMRNQFPVFDKAAANTDISPLADLRALIASRLVVKCSALTPGVRAAFHDQYDKCASTEERDVLRHTSNLLLSKEEQLGTQIDHCLRQRFDAKVECAVDAVNDGQFSMEAFELTEGSDQPEDLAIEQCASQIEKQCHSELSLLSSSTRLCKVMDCESLPESRNPASPQVILRALVDALTQIGCDASTRRAVLTTFTPMMPKVMKDIYARANAMLADVERADEIECAPWQAALGRQGFAHQQGARM